MKKLLLATVVLAAPMAQSSIKMTDQKVHGQVGVYTVKDVITGEVVKHTISFTKFSLECERYKNSVMVAASVRSDDIITHNKNVDIRIRVDDNKPLVSGGRTYGSFNQYATTNISEYSGEYSREDGAEWIKQLKAGSTVVWAAGVTHGQRSLAGSTAGFNDWSQRCKQTYGVKL